MSHPTRKMGRLPARHDPRIPPMTTRVDMAALPPPPLTSNWYAAQPPSGIKMLGNGRYGCCIEASIAHYLAAIATYTNPLDPIEPTEEEVLVLYHAITGFNRDDPTTDNGTYFMGPGGAVEYWARHGVTIGGRHNRPDAVVTVDHRNLERVKQAINLFGFVFCGAALRQADLDSAFIWMPSGGPILGGHEFLFVGYEHVAGHDYFDVLTWDGLWRASDDWLLQSVDECAAVLDRGFVDKAGVNPAGVAWADLSEDLKKIAVV